ncbi:MULTISPECIES: DUF4426 domain-containing protein [Pseudomonadaceae]|uniref:DUF4426 domain-containing protein n=1 Tax=Pseudomonas saudiphocaensis TaxID=1499686 RepID=A0A078LU87_9PSED|nr:MULTISPECIES: DUF4426 domain-containing protein [Pseudomonadaceae]MBE7926410.1 DUF4426 domain-containing protein [Pseudomonas saudiphocaensis]MCF6780217.1 DUF4426 domain-containing protein [Stutzerimonas stutzeri]MCF6804846.1 DUF4426 domain-containing protein [Stutzerimonas stutzeri]RRV17420.1 DUF4426 domain-containing protein [Pseudomonas saudiphocaensis]CDZ94764.1 hypothetical protein BN1079_02089 [Pseudomonas saudiphocaensis]
MKASLIALLTLLLALPAWAERKHSFGEYDVHYIAFNSGFLQPDIAAAAGLVRSKSQGVLNVSVLKAGKPTMALVSGTVKNLLGQDRPLAFKQLKEGEEAIYYLAQFPFDSRETLRFSLTVQPVGAEAVNFEFTQEFFPDR